MYKSCWKAVIIRRGNTRTGARGGSAPHPGENEFSGEFGDRGVGTTKPGARAHVENPASFRGRYMVPVHTHARIGNLAFCGVSEVLKLEKRANPPPLFPVPCSPGRPVGGC